MCVAPAEAPARQILYPIELRSWLNRRLPEVWQEASSRSEAGPLACPLPLKSALAIAQKRRLSRISPFRWRARGGARLSDISSCALRSDSQAVENASG